MLATSQLIYLIVITLLSLVTGIWLSQKGHPYNKAISAIHKLLSVIFIGSVVFITLPLLKETNWSGNYMVWFVLFSIFSLASIATGSVLMSAVRAYPWLRLSHKATPYLTYIFAVLYLYYLTG